MAHFSDLLNDARGWQTTVEKCRSLKGLEELLRVGRSYIRTALPQVARIHLNYVRSANLLDMCVYAIRTRYCRIARLRI